MSWCVNGRLRRLNAFVRAGTDTSEGGVGPSYTPPSLPAGKGLRTAPKSNPAAATEAFPAWFLLVLRLALLLLLLLLLPWWRWCILSSIISSAAAPLARNESSIAPCCFSSLSSQLQLAASVVIADRPNHRLTSPAVIDSLLALHGSSAPRERPAAFLAEVMNSRISGSGGQGSDRPFPADGAAADDGATADADDAEADAEDDSCDHSSITASVISSGPNSTSPSESIKSKKARDDSLCLSLASRLLFGVDDQVSKRRRKRDTRVCSMVGSRSRRGCS